MIPYENLDHTADLGLKIYGKNLSELFSNAGLAFADQITEAKFLNPTLEKKIQIKAENPERLLLKFLKEILYLFETEQLLFCKFTIQELSDTLFTVTAKGEAFDLSKHPFKTSLKAVTHHCFKIEKTQEGYVATVIFDV